MNIEDVKVGMRIVDISDNSQGTVTKIEDNRIYARWDNDPTIQLWLSADQIGKVGDVTTLVLQIEVHMSAIQFLLDQLKGV